MRTLVAILRSCITVQNREAAPQLTLYWRALSMLKDRQTLRKKWRATQLLEDAFLPLFVHITIA